MSTGHKVCGAPLLPLVEPKRNHKLLKSFGKEFVITRSYKIKWYKPEKDLSVLAKKRWIEQIDTKDLADYFEIKEVTIKGDLRYLRNRGGLEKTKLTPNEMRQVKKAIDSGIL